MKRPRVAAGYLGVYAVLAITDVVAELADLTPLTFVLPALLMPVLAAYLLVRARAAGTERTRLVVLVTIALGFSWLGDTAGQTLLIKIAFFLLAQIAYCVAFWPYRARSLLGRRVPAAAYAVLLLGLIGFVATQAGALGAPVFLYGTSLALMLALAPGVSRLSAVGAVIFLASDLGLAYEFFLSAPDSGNAAAYVMATYLPAQLLIVLGVLHRVGADASQPVDLLAEPRR